MSGWALFRDAAPRGVGKTLTSAAAFVACYAASGLAQAWPMSLHAVFLLSWLAHAATFPGPDRRRVAYAVVLGVLGPVWEGWGTRGHESSLPVPVGRWGACTHTQPMAR